MGSCNWEIDAMNVVPVAAQGHIPDRPAKTRPYWVTVMSLACLATASHAAAPTISGSVIAGGAGSSNSPGKCFKLNTTLGQHTAGHSSGGTFAIDAGFLPGHRDNDPIFHHGFEVCS